jgi:hypothetical protein
VAPASRLSPITHIPTCVNDNTPAGCVSRRLAREHLCHVPCGVCGHEDQQRPGGHGREVLAGAAPRDAPHLQGEEQDEDAHSGRYREGVGIGALGGAAAGLISNPAVGMAVGNGVANFVSQAAVAHTNGRGDFDTESFGLSMLTGAVGGIPLIGIEAKDAGDLVFQSVLPLAVDIGAQIGHYVTHPH